MVRKYKTNLEIEVDRQEYLYDLAPTSLIYLFYISVFLPHPPHSYKN